MLSLPFSPAVRLTRATGVSLLRAAWVLACLLPSLALEAREPSIFPLPQEAKWTGSSLLLDESVEILVPTNASSEDLLLAGQVSRDLSTRFRIAARVRSAARIPELGRVIVMGDFQNPLVQELAEKRGIKVRDAEPGPEGYVLQVDAGVALVVGTDARGAFYGMQSLRQLIGTNGGRTSIRGALVRDWPYKAFRGIRLYIPGPENIAFFKRFIRDFMALNKFNHLILELNAAMRLDRHPELNAGALDLADTLTGERRNRPFGPRGEDQDSVHHDNADGAILEKSDVADLVRYARAHHIEVVPEIPSLSHSYYLLTRHKELAEMPDAEWPDAYCPSNPASRDLLFEVLEEYIEVMQPRTVHIGHDEWRVRVGACPKCRDRDLRELYAEDVTRIHAWLRAKGISTMMWGDHLIERLRGKETYAMKTQEGFAYQRPGGLSAEQVQKLIPKDILVANWMWQEPYPGQGEVNDLDLAKWGFRQLYGNLEPQIREWGRRSANPSVMGGAASSWAATTEYNFGKDLILEFMAVANLLWSKHWPGMEELTGLAQSEMPVIRERLSGVHPYSATGVPQAFAALSSDDRAAERTGELSSGHVRFQVRSGEAPVRVSSGGRSAAIAIAADVSSLVFLHAVEGPAANFLSYKTIHNFADTADLVGHYEVAYEDGYVTTVPIRYGVNILERAWSPSSRPRVYCYSADPVTVGNNTFFAYEWRNPRLGKAIKSVSVQATAAFVDASGTPAQPNGLHVKAITLVLPKPVRDNRSGSKPDIAD